MKRKYSWKNSQWSLSFYALIVLIGGVVGSSLVNPSLFYILGALSGSLLLVIINFFYVIYKKRKSKSKK